MCPDARVHQAPKTPRWPPPCACWRLVDGLRGPLLAAKCLEVRHRCLYRQLLRIGPSSLDLVPVDTFACLLPHHLTPLALQ